MNDNRRTFLRRALAAPFVTGILGNNLFAAAKDKIVIENADETTATQTPANQAKPFTLPALRYDYAALEPHIDRETMQLHHDKHHQTYVDNLNKAVEKYPNLGRQTPEQLISGVDRLPADIRETVRNNGGGHVNHTMFWEIMKPGGGGQPTGAIGTAIKNQFGSFDAFKKEFNDAGAKRFGSGWAWLVRQPGGGLRIISTANQDNPIMQNLEPIMGNDVWEHAYYLTYRNRRADYLQAWWNTVNWDEINNRLRASRRS